MLVLAGSHASKQSLACRDKLIEDYPYVVRNPHGRGHLDKWAESA